MDRPAVLPMLSLRLPRLSDPATPPPALAAPSRAAELLTAAAAHRIFVEHRLGGEQTAEAQQQTGHQLAEMLMSAMVGMELSIRKTRAAELLTAAAAHRIFVEHCLRDQQQTGHQLAEMLEGWMTGEDAIEVACWHMQSTDTCNLAHGKRPRTGTAKG